MQSDQSLCLPLEYSMNVKLLAEHHLEFLSLKGGFIGQSESTLVKMPLHLSKCQIEMLEITCHGSYYKAKEKQTVIVFNSIKMINLVGG